jgi:hypothetical protein
LYLYRAGSRFPAVNPFALLITRFRRSPDPLLQHSPQEIAVQGPAALPALLRAIDGGCPGHRVRAIAALALIADTAAERHLINSLGDVEPAVRTAASRALGAMGTEAAIPFLRVAVDEGVKGAPDALVRMVERRPEWLPAVLRELQGAQRDGQPLDLAQDRLLRPPFGSPSRRCAYRSRALRDRLERTQGETFALPIPAAEPVEDLPVPAEAVVPTQVFLPLPHLRPSHS